MYINNTVIKLLIYFNSRMRIDELIINIIPKKTFSKILEKYFFLEKYLRQPSMDFDVCNLLSSGDVIYKERC